ncbi:CvpA family protein [Desulfitobacterium chlororespirans]|uniref:Colicin V production protein n=1 Tax=Desulfitobacterium chlororespirans DSM 11544 TaxID=1121395 RepID=A0A1M7TFP7_9FIRM|nr:CvpA family protein [Desulfitobacterium chlororespirans]SHN69526.1 Colicin V production protein [Desulfitobacterium chlororespirans DSM 11544]
MNSFDMLILAIVLIGAIQGYRKGLISGLISLGGSILGLVLAAKNYPILLQWLEQNTPLRDWLETVMYQRMLPSVQAKAAMIQEETLDKILSMFPEEFKDILSGSNLPDMQIYTDSVMQSIAQNFTQAFADNALKIISFALIYFGVILLVEIVSAILLAPLGLLTTTINGGGGFIVGGLVTFLGLAIFVGLFSPLITMANPDETIGFFENSTLYPYLKETFAYLGELLRFNIEQGLKWPLDLQELNLPIDLKDIPLPNLHNVDL